MISEKERQLVRGFLKDLSPEDLQAVAVSISKHNITPTSYDGNVIFYFAF